MDYNFWQLEILGSSVEITFYLTERIAERHVHTFLIPKNLYDNSNDYVGDYLEIPKTLGCCLACYPYLRVELPRFRKIYKHLLKNREIDEVYLINKKIEHYKAEISKLEQSIKYRKGIPRREV